MRKINGDEYFVGSWKDGVPEGKCFIYKPEKILFLGDFHHGVPEGHSQIRFIDQQIDFEGELHDGKANGQGILDNFQSRFSFKG